MSHRSTVPYSSSPLSRERDLETAIRQREGEVESAQDEIAERNALLLKATSAIQQLQLELQAARREGEDLKNDATKVRPWRVYMK